jgi:hypothetical protein
MLIMATDIDQRLLKPWVWQLRGRNQKVMSQIGSRHKYKDNIKG